MKVYTQNKTESNAILTKILSAFQQYNITPNPINFAIWYEYYLGNNTELNTQLEQALQNRDAYTDSLGMRIYDTYLKDKHTDTSELEKAFRKLLNMMVSKLMDWTKKMDNHASALDTYVHQLSDNSIDPEMLKNLTGHVLNTTRSIMASQTDLHGDLLTASQQIKALQAELEASRKDAMTDILTRIANRRWFEHDMDMAMQACEEDNSLALILLDIDHFKKFNDTYGHLIGDGVLRFIASIIKSNIESTQLVARLGGEEFAVLIPDSSITQAIDLAEKLRQEVQSSQLTRKDTGEIISNITISLGVGTYRPTETWESFYQRVDAALYQAKHNGRNQVSAAAV